MSTARHHSGRRTTAASNGNPGQGVAASSRESATQVHLPSADWFKTQCCERSSFPQGVLEASWSADTLRAYCRRFELRPRHRASKAELAQLVAAHFHAQTAEGMSTLTERQTITAFLQTLLRQGWNPVFILFLLHVHSLTSYLQSGQERRNPMEKIVIFSNVEAFVHSIVHKYFSVYCSRGLTVSP